MIIKIPKPILNITNIKYGHRISIDLDAVLCDRNERMFCHCCILLILHSYPTRTRQMVYFSLMNRKMKSNSIKFGDWSKCWFLFVYSSTPEKTTCKIIQRVESDIKGQSIRHLHCSKSSSNNRSIIVVHFSHRGSNTFLRNSFIN